MSDESFPQEQQPEDQAPQTPEDSEGVSYVQKEGQGLSGSNAIIDQQQPFDLTSLEEPERVVDTRDEAPATEPNDQNPDAGRWDHDAAYDIAHQPKVRAIMESNAEDRRDVNSEEFRSNYKTTWGDSMRVAERNVALAELDAPRMGDPDRYVAGAKRDLEIVNEEFGREKRRRLANIGKLEADYLEPWKALYDANPGKFSSMPASEFIDKVKELGEFDRNLKQCKEELDYIKGIRRLYEQSIEKDRPMAVSITDWAESVAWRANLETGVDDGSYYEEMSQYGNGWKHTGKEAYQKYLEEIKKYQPLFEQDVEQSAQKREEFLNQFRPQPEATTEPNEDDEFRFPDEHEG